MYFILSRKKEKLHLLLGLQSASCWTSTRPSPSSGRPEEEAEVIPNLMIGFGIDEMQAEYVAEIKLRNINKEYILKRVRGDGAACRERSQDLEDTLQKPARIRRIMVEELTQVRKKYAQPRKTEIIYRSRGGGVSRRRSRWRTILSPVFLSREGYFKKITPQSLRMSGEQKLQGGRQAPAQQAEATNAAEVCCSSPTGVRSTRPASASSGTARPRVLGDYLPAKLGMDEGESVVYMVLPGDYSGHLLFFFENGKIARVEMKRLRHRLQPPQAHRGLLRQEQAGGHSAAGGGSGAGAAVHGAQGADLPHVPAAAQGHPLHAGRGGHDPEAQIPAATSLHAGGVRYRESPRYRARSIPGTGALLRPEDRGEEQLTLL